MNNYCVTSHMPRTFSTSSVRLGFIVIINIVVNGPTSVRSLERSLHRTSFSIIVDFGIINSSAVVATLDLQDDFIVRTDSKRVQSIFYWFTSFVADLFPSFRLAEQQTGCNKASLLLDWKCGHNHGLNTAYSWYKTLGTRVNPFVMTITRRA